MLFHEHTTRAPSRSGSRQAFAVRPVAGLFRRNHYLAVALLIWCVGSTSFVPAAEVIPPAPRDHFNDYSRLVRPDVAQSLNRELAQFERETSNQIVAAIYPRMQSDSSVEDYTIRVAQAWRVGQGDRKNGAVLFVFAEERQVYIQVGYGLEAALPDALAKRIIEDEIVPHFRSGNFAAGLTAGLRAMQAATRGEYRGIARTAKEGAAGERRGFPLIGLILFLFVMMALRSSRRRNVLYQRGGRRSIWMGSGPWGRGGFGGGGGGTFSGGGGGFGGGGAGGRW